MARGFHEYATGELVETADINDKFVNQGVMYFADATARDAAITSPVEGMHAYLADTDTWTFYTGAAWKAVSLEMLEERELADLSDVSGTTPGTGQGLVYDGSQWAPTALSAGMGFEGSNTTEQSTTSTTAVDLVTISSLNIAAVRPMLVVVEARNPTGSQQGIGLKLNSTIVEEAAIGASTLSYTNSNAKVFFWLGPRETNYTSPGLGQLATLSGSLEQVALSTSAAPTSAVTSVAIRSVMETATSGYVKAVYVYSMETS